MAAPRALSPLPSAKVPTDWKAGVVLSVRRLGTASSPAGTSYLQVNDAYLRGDIFAPVYWPESDVVVLWGGASFPMEIPGRGPVGCTHPAYARWTITDHVSPDVSEAYLIELGLRDIRGNGRMEIHVFANGVYIPVARVGETDRYMGVVSLRGGFGGLDLYLGAGSEPVAFYYMKVQRIPG